MCRVLLCIIKKNYWFGLELFFGEYLLSKIISKKNNFYHMICDIVISQNFIIDYDES